MKEKFNKIKGKLFAAFYFIVGLSYNLPMMASADNDPWGPATDNAANIVMEVIEIFTGLIALLGAFFLVVGGFKLFMAWKGNNPEEMNGAIKETVGGAALLLFGTLFAPVLSLTGLVQ